MSDTGFNCAQLLSETDVVLASNILMKNRRHGRQYKYGKSIRACTIKRKSKRERQRDVTNNQTGR